MISEQRTEVLHMLSILRRGTEIQISCADQVIGIVTISRNPMHGQHCNLTLELTRYDPSLVGELFRQYDYDCDSCAMTVKAMFRVKDDGSWDTNILD